MSKKQRVLSNLFEEALVPKDEQPFEIPESWVWVYLGKVSRINMGASPKGEYTTEDSSYYPLVGGPADMGITFPKVSRYTRQPTKLSTKDEVILSVRATLGKTNISNAEYCLGRGVAGIKSKAINVDFLRFYFDTITSYLYEISTGTTFQQISKRDIENIPFPLPTLDEQKIIANKIDYLFAKIDEAKQLIEEAKATFELRRAAIFKEVYGDPSEVAGGVWKTIGELFYVQVGSTPSRKVDDYWNGQYPWLSSGEVNFNRVVNSKEKVTDLAVKEARLKLAPKGSILFGMIGEGKTRGQVAILDIDSYHNQNMASIWVSESNIPIEYVYYWFVSKYTENRQNSSGNNQPAYNKTRVQALTIPIYEKSMMQEKLKILSKLEELESRVNDLLDLEQNISDIKRSILSRAYKGELRTNDSTDQPAIELLKSILLDKL